MASSLSGATGSHPSEHPHRSRPPRRLCPLVDGDLPRELGKLRLEYLQWVLVGSTAGTYGAGGWLLRGAGVHAQPVRDHGQTAPLYPRHRPLRAHRGAGSAPAL